MKPEGVIDYGQYGSTHGLSDATIYALNKQLHSLNGELTTLRTQLAASEARERQLREALEECVDGFEFTRQYVGYEMLPAIDGWSWYDADKKAKAALALPTDTTALREVCLRVAEVAQDDGHNACMKAIEVKSWEDIVDEVLNENRI